MRKGRMRAAAFVMAACMLVGSIPATARAANPGGVEYLNTYVNTGNQRQDIVGVALTQLGYREIGNNDTKYGDWCGYPYQPWCASFVSWCARQAEVSTDIIKKSARAHPNYFDLTYYHGKKYTPKPGDLFFTEEFNHVGIVWYVEGAYFYTIEGNAEVIDPSETYDPNEDSYHVVSNKRLISKFYFGVPAYEGCDKDHDYVKGTESAHPHKDYYQCAACGDKYYTGYTTCKAGCGKCFTCGCSSSAAGYYVVSSSTSPIKVRTSHSTSADYLGYVSDGAVVYVHGASQSAGWACIEYDGMRGHILLKYLKKHPGIPASPQPAAAKAEYLLHDDVTVTWNTPANTEQFLLKVFRDGALIEDKNMGMTASFTLKDLPSGSYEVRVAACNRAGVSAPGTLKFTVLDDYTLTYDAAGGTGAPGAQTQPAGAITVVSGTAPVRAGYTFLGWTTQAQGRFAQYQAGDTLSADHDITLYAVWKSDSAALAEMTIARMPERVMFLKGERLDTAGLVLELTYSDGSGHHVSDGFTAEGFDSETYGTKTITVTRDTLSVTYEVQVVPYLPGDMDLNKIVNRDDVMQLLWHISFPDQFTIPTPADFNGDGVVNRDDVMQLLWHISFPDQFPLDIEWPQEEEPTEPGEGEEPTEPIEDPTGPGGGDDGEDKGE